MQRIRKDDRVKVIAGKDRGAEGRVIRYIPDTDKVLVEGVNHVTKHVPLRANNRGQQEGGIIETEAFFSASNVQPICPSCSKPTRVGFVLESEGDRRSKVRSCRHCQGTF